MNKLQVTESHVKYELWTKLFGIFSPEGDSIFQNIVCMFADTPLAMKTLEETYGDFVYLMVILW